MKYILDHDDLFCKFCHKECKNKNSLCQHELRCKNNPNRKDFDRMGKWSHKNLKGQTKDTSIYVKKYSDTLKQHYDEGLIDKSNKKYKNVTNYIYQDHNDQEIQKWLDYIDTKDIQLPEYHVVPIQNTTQYIYVSRCFDSNLKFEHRFIANYYINNNLLKSNCVHHIDNNKQNNNIHNLMIFETTSDHKRYHYSKNAYLIYDDTTHLFKCIKKNEKYLKKQFTNEMK